MTPLKGYSVYQIMGLCACTMVGCPVGCCVGSCCCTPSIPVVLPRYNGLTNSLFLLAAVFVIVYMPLAILCPKEHWWSIFPLEGDCWSEGGDMPYFPYGLVTGVIMGISVVWVIRSFYRQYSSPNPTMATNATEMEREPTLPMQIL